MLTHQDIDNSYDWRPHVGLYSHPSFSTRDYWKLMKEKNPASLDVEDLPLQARDTLNPELAYNSQPPFRTSVPRASCSVFRVPCSVFCVPCAVCRPPCPIPDPFRFSG